jgi:hypothetical protein
MLRILWSRSVLRTREFGADIRLVGKGEGRDRAKCPAMSGNSLKPFCALCATASNPGLQSKASLRNSAKE